METQKLENKKIEREQNLLKALAVSWAIRADGKMSRAGFYSCLKEVEKIVPDDVWEDIRNSTLHAHDSLNIFIENVMNELPDEYKNMVGGDLPSIEIIEEKLREI